ncbi:antibiotic biosynthesis monooxygenase [Sporosarcina sp. FSL K6-1522]|uniref:antibiotic biosynthesis monooxygenase family protein n=1 Tax=Sporosarcina sp. FSL K6-1522 TaxID=2921554 RepID=UPI00315A3BB7
MFIYLTSGTPAFMEKLKEQYVSEAMIVLHGSGNSILLHETQKKSVFQTPRRYEVISSAGAFADEGYFVLNHIPVTDEGRPIFEHSFKTRSSIVDSELGFIAFRLLRPLNSDTYIMLTEWTDAAHYNRWKDSAVFRDSHFADTLEAGVDNQLHMFSSAPYITTYLTKNNNDDA